MSASLVAELEATAAVVAAACDRLEAVRELRLMRDKPPLGKDARRLAMVMRGHAERLAGLLDEADDDGLDDAFVRLGI